MKTYMHTYRHEYIYAYTRAYMHTCIHRLNTCMHASRPIERYIYTCTYILRYLHACIHARFFTRFILSNRSVVKLTLILFRKLRLTLCVSPKSRAIIIIVDLNRSVTTHPHHINTVCGYVRKFSLL